MAADLRQALELPVQVISLRRSKERRAAFVQRNGETGLDYVFVDGVDGVQQLDAIFKSRRGLLGYVLTPRGAQKLLLGLPRFEAEPLLVGRGIPQVPSMTFDAQMNRLYPELQAFVVVPPLVLAENDQETSMTAPRQRSLEFGVGE